MLTRNLSLTIKPYHHNILQLYSNCTCIANTINEQFYIYIDLEQLFISSQIVVNGLETL